MRRAALVFFLLLAAAPANAAGWLGAYVWGGVITQSTGVQRFNDTVGAVLAAGFDTVRVAVGPTAIDGVPLGPSCTGSNNTLTCYAKIMFASSAWDDPKLKRVMLTAIDQKCQSLASGNQGCFTASLLTANKAAIQQEYTDLFSYLAQRFSGRSVQFILSNWEGDNFVYCGDAFGYSQGGSITASCNATISANGQTNAQRVQALLLWFSYKDEAVANFVAATPSFSLIHAPEFSAYNLFAGGCGGSCAAGTPSSDIVLGQIQAAGGRQYCSYSSYDSQGPASGTYLAATQAILGICQNLIIGEAGYDLLSARGLGQNVMLFKALDQLRQVPKVLGVIPWNAVNPVSGAQKFGLFDTDGRDQLLRFYGPIRPARPVPTYR